MTTSEQRSNACWNSPTAWAPGARHLASGSCKTHCSSIKQRRIDKRGRTQALANLAEMNIAVDPNERFCLERYVDRGGPLRSDSYDASYLNWRGGKHILATLDRQLRAAVLYDPAVRKQLNRSSSLSAATAALSS
jgi:hypothetical protein